MNNNKITVLGGNYTIGSATWDTGVCEECGNRLSIDARKQACINMLVSGMMYWCEYCIKQHFSENKGMFR